jgi:hypothetical protein
MLNIENNFALIISAPTLKPCKADIEPTPFVLTKSHYSKFFEKKKKKRRKGERKKNKKTY